MTIKTLLHLDNICITVPESLHSLLRQYNFDRHAFIHAERNEIRMVSKKEIRKVSESLRNTLMFQLTLIR